MDGRVQFSTRNALLATAGAAVWCALYAAHGRLNQMFGTRTFEYQTIYYAVLVGLPAFIVATLFGRPGLGAFCGLASGLAVVAIQLNA